jgi:hypothetical protein
MNDPHSIAVRVEAFNGTWETMGIDRYRGVLPEQVQFTFNAMGPDTASFILKRDPRGIYPDLGTFTPVEIEVGGRVVWDGRIKETPIDDGENPQISVQCEGWQYHLDDDVYYMRYVHTRLSSFQDVRASVTAPLYEFHAAGQVQAGDAGLSITRPANTAIDGTGLLRDPCGAVFDMGEDLLIEYVSIDWALTSGFGTVDVDVNITGQDDPADYDFTTNTVRFAHFTSGVSSDTSDLDYSSAPVRAIAIDLRAGNASVITPTVDLTVQISGIRIFAKKAYESGGQSVLRAGTVIKDALTQAAPLLSADLSDIDSGTFNIPELSMDGAHTPREVITAVNAYENFDIRVVPGRKLRFKPRQSVPVYEIGEWRGTDFQDASANSGEDLYNRVIVEGTGPDGNPVSVKRTQAGPPWADGPAISNPSMESATGGVPTGWSQDTGTIAQSTTQKHTGSNSLRMTAGASGVDAGTTFPTLTPGLSYQLSIWLYRTVSVTSVGLTMFPFDEDPDRTLLLGNADLPLNTWTKVDFVFVANDGPYEFDVFVEGPTSGIAMYVDDLYLAVATGTLMDRRGFRRTKILEASSAITTAVGARIGDLFLQSNRTIPFKGSFQAVGLGGVRDIFTGVSIDPAHLVVGELVRCSHRIDPDTGGWGRDGTIAAVSYTHDTLTASVSLDENREGFEALLQRLAVVTGQKSI